MQLKTYIKWLPLLLTYNVIKTVVKPLLGLAGRVELLFRLLSNLVDMSQMVMVIKNESNKPFKLLRLVKNKHMELLQNRSTLNSAIFILKQRSNARKTGSNNKPETYLLLQLVRFIGRRMTSPAAAHDCEPHYL